MQLTLVKVSSQSCRNRIPLLIKESCYFLHDHVVSQSLSTGHILWKENKARFQNFNTQIDALFLVFKVAWQRGKYCHTVSDQQVKRCLYIHNCHSRISVNLASMLLETANKNCCYLKDIQWQRDKFYSILLPLFSFKRFLTKTKFEQQILNYLLARAEYWYYLHLDKWFLTT